MKQTMNSIGKRLFTVGRREWVFLLLLLATTIIRFWSLSTIPSNLLCDEADNLREIWQIIAYNRPPLFGLDWKPQAAFSQHFAAFFVKHLGENPRPYIEQLQQVQAPAQQQQIINEWRNNLATLRDVFALRFNPALFSVLLLIPFYQLMRRTVRRPPALVAVACLATNPMFLNFSRSGWENIHVPLATLIAIWGIVRIMEAKGAWWLNAVMTSVGVAWGLYGYFSGRAIPIMIAISATILLLLYPYRQTEKRPWLGSALWACFWLLIAGPLLILLPLHLIWDEQPLWLRVLVGVLGIVGVWWLTKPTYLTIRAQIWNEVSKSRYWKVVGGYCLASVLGVLLFTPQIPEITKNWGHFVSRMRTVSAFSVSYPRDQFQTQWDLMRHSAVQTIKSPIYPVNLARRYAPPEEPLLHPVCGFFLILGVLVGIWQWPRHFWWWVMLLVPYFTTQVITTRSPHCARAIGMIPMLFYFMAVGLDRVPWLWYGLGIRRVPIVLIAGTLLVNTQQLRNYVDWITHPQTLHDRGPQVDLAEYPYWAIWQHRSLARREQTYNTDEWLREKDRVINEYRDATDTTTAAAGPFVSATETRFLAPEAPTQHDAPPTPPPGIELSPLHDMMHEYAETTNPVLGEPEGRAFNGIENEDVLLVYYGNPEWKGAPTNIGWTTDLELRAVPEREVSMKWHATLTIPETGEYEFAMLTDDGGQLILNDQPVLTDLMPPHAARTVANRVQIDAGEYALTVRYYQHGGAYSMVLFWRPPGHPLWGPIPAELLSAPRQEQ